MLRFEREEEILNILRAKKRVSVADLEKILYSSASSIRRDLTSLENKGLVKRYYGGVELLQSNSNVTTFAARTHQNVAARRIMAKKAAALVREGDIIFLDQSTSCLYVAHALMDKSGITVVTSSVEILALLGQSKLEVYSCGGMLSHANRNCLVGDDAHNAFRAVRADYMFFASKAISDDGTIYDCTRQEVCLRNTMMENANKIVYLCDSGKFGTMASYRQCTLKQVDYLICEQSVPEVYRHSYPALTIL